VRQREHQSGQALQVACDLAQHLAQDRRFRWPVISRSTSPPAGPAAITDRALWDGSLAAAAWQAQLPLGESSPAPGAAAGNRVGQHSLPP
jgi:hypothetical protein